MKIRRKKNKKKNEDSISSLWDNSRSPTLAPQGCQKEKRKSKKLEIYFKN